MTAGVKAVLLTVCSVSLLMAMILPLWLVRYPSPMLSLVLIVPLAILSNRTGWWIGQWLLERKRNRNV